MASNSTHSLTVALGVLVRTFHSCMLQVIFFLSSLHSQGKPLPCASKVAATSFILIEPFAEVV